MRMILISAFIALASCGSPTAVPGDIGSGVTLAQYQSIQDGMTYAEVSKILGSPGVEQSSNTLGGIRTVMYAWDGKTGLGNMNAMFQNDKLIQKAQFGLE